MTPSRLEEQFGKWVAENPRAGSLLMLVTLFVVDLLERKREGARGAAPFLGPPASSSKDGEA